VRVKASTPCDFYAGACSGTVQQVRTQLEHDGGVVYCTIVYNCIVMLSLTGGHQLSTPSSKEPGLSNTVLLACSAPRWCLMRIYLFRTHAGIAAVALSDFVTDAAGLIDAHDVARVLLQLHSRCFVGLILAKNLLTV
jgi:hypothetical protein